MSVDDQKRFREATGNAISATKKKTSSGRTKLEIFREKYGEDGPQKYGEYLQKIFKSIGYSKEASNLIENIISENEWLSSQTLFYRSEDGNHKEWFISDDSGVYFYDFVVKEAKVILEYDGSTWHPTKEQVSEFGEELMLITGISYMQAYNRDQNKIAMAEKNGFEVFKIRSDDSEDLRNSIITNFIKRIKEKCNINQ